MVQVLALPGRSRLHPVLLLPLRLPAFVMVSIFVAQSRPTSDAGTTGTTSSLQRFYIPYPGYTVSFEHTLATESQKLMSPSHRMASSGSQCPQRPRGKPDSITSSACSVSVFTRGRLIHSRHVRCLRDLIYTTRRPQNSSFTFDLKVDLPPNLRDLREHVPVYQPGRFLMVHTAE